MKQFRKVGDELKSALDDVKSRLPDYAHPVETCELCLAELTFRDRSEHTGIFHRHGSFVDEQFVIMTFCKACNERYVRSVEYLEAVNETARQKVQG
jgi:hypothetical protein